MPKLSDDWSNAFTDSFSTEEEVIDFIFERFNTNDFEDSYIYMNIGCSPNEAFKYTAEDKRQTFYDFMMYLIEEKDKLQQEIIAIKDNI